MNNSIHLSKLGTDGFNLILFGTKVSDSKEFYKKSIVMFFLLFIMVGCASKNVKPTVKKESKSSVEHNETLEEKGILSKIYEQIVNKKDEVESGEVLANVFSDELYFEKDKVGQDKTGVVIKYLDAYAWEKKVLNRAYKKHKKLWSKKQSKDFEKILQHDKYLSLCSDHKYWDNLEFEESEPERDILHSILLLRYLNNLSHGCVDWVQSDGKIKDENRREYINAKYIFSLLPYNVLIDKLLFIYAPKELEFKKMLQSYHKALERGQDSKDLKQERLIIELYKRKERYPNYKRREK